MKAPSTSDTYSSKRLVDSGTVIGSLTGQQIAANVSLCEQGDGFGGDKTRFGDRDHVC
jgi:hypothetical protein